jgi:hypothetical protein
MNGRSSEIMVRVVYGQPLAEALEASGVNGHLGKALCTEPRWDVLPVGSLAKTLEDVTARGVTLFQGQASGNIHAVLASMGRRSLRPASVHEFLALTQLGIELPLKMVGLGALWGEEIGQEKVLCWQQGEPHLASASSVWPEGTFFPAVYYSGQTNPLPGMPGSCSS